MSSTKIARVLRNRRWTTRITIERPQEGTYIDGEYIRGTDPTTFEITAIVTPMRRLALPTTYPWEQTRVEHEGARSESSLMIYTETKLNVVTDQQPGDRITDLHGDDWVIQSCERWDEYGFYVVIASAVPRGLNQ